MAFTRTYQLIVEASGSDANSDFLESSANAITRLVDLITIDSLPGL